MLSDGEKGVATCYLMGKRVWQHVSQRVYAVVVA